MSTPAERIDGWLDRLAEGVVLISHQRVERVNQAAAQMLGVDRDWASGRPAMAVLRDHRLERVWLTGRPEELIVGGRSVRAVPFEGGLALRDITEARKAQANARELLAVLSHELRTPLTTVRSTLEALEYHHLPNETRSRLLSRAIGESERLVRLLDDLTADVAPQRERSIRLSETIDRACAVVAPAVAAHRADVRHQIHGTVWADPDKLLQILINLIENAAVHGPDGFEIEILAEEVDGWARIAVRDRGEPLSAEHFESLFELHARGTAATSRGTGLGLYVVRSIANRWGGRAWGEPWSDGTDGEERHGNAFCFLVPMTRNASSTPPP